MSRTDSNFFNGLTKMRLESMQKKKLVDDELERVEQERQEALRIEQK
jgi:hypothetical protein